MSEDSELKCAHSLANFPVSPKSKRWNRHINQSHDLLKHQDLSVSMPSLEPCKKHRYKKYARTVGTQTRSQHHIYSESSSMLKKGSSCISMENTGTADVGDGASNVSDWRQMGRELRHIADDLRRSTPSLDSSSGDNEFFSLFYSNYFTHEMSQPARRRCFSAGASSVSDDDTQANYQRLDQLLSNLFDVLQQILMTQRRIREAQLPQNSPRLRNGQSNSRRNGDGTEPFLSFLPPDLPSLFTNSEARISADMLRPTTLQSASSSSSPVELTGHNESRRYGCPTSSHGRRVTRRRRCRRRTMSDSTCCDESKPDSLQEVTASSQPEASAQLWTQVGVNLRKIADEFYSSVGKAEPSQEYEEIKRPCGVESSPADTSLLSMLVPPPFAGSVWTAVIFVVGWRLLTRAR